MTWADPWGTCPNPVPKFYDTNILLDCRLSLTVLKTFHPWF